MYFSFINSSQRGLDINFILERRLLLNSFRNIIWFRTGASKNCRKSPRTGISTRCDLLSKLKNLYPTRQSWLYHTSLDYRNRRHLKSNRNFHQNQFLNLHKRSMYQNLSRRGHWPCCINNRNINRGWKLNGLYYFNNISPFQLKRVYKLNSSFRQFIRKFLYQNNSSRLNLLKFRNGNYSRGFDFGHRNYKWTQNCGLKQNTRKFGLKTSRKKRQPKKTKPRKKGFCHHLTYRCGDQNPNPNNDSSSLKKSIQGLSQSKSYILSCFGHQLRFRWLRSFQLLF